MYGRYDGITRKSTFECTIAEGDFLIFTVQIFRPFSVLSGFGLLFPLSLHSLALFINYHDDNYFTNS